MQKVSGYDGEGPDGDPPSTGGDDVCPYCRLSPCIIARPPNWLRGSSQASLGNQAKRFRLYKKFWTLLGQLGLWNDPHYLALKVTKTSIMDKRDVMPLCVVTVSKKKQSILTMLIFLHLLIWFRRSEEDFLILWVFHTLTSSHRNSRLKYLIISITLD